MSEHERSAVKGLVAGAIAGAAGVLAMGLFARALPRGRERHGAKGNEDAMNAAMGVFAGATFGLAAERSTRVTAAAGLPYGASVWLTATEPSGSGRARGHIESLLGHLIFGATTNAVRALLRRTVLK